MIRRNYQEMAKILTKLSIWIDEVSDTPWSDLFAITIIHENSEVIIITLATFDYVHAYAASW